MKTSLFDIFCNLIAPWVDSYPKPMKQAFIPAKLVELAKSMVGRHEEPLGSNAGPQIQEFFAADSYKPNKADNGYAWCASFVCRLVQLALQQLAIEETATFKRPTTPSAFGLIDWSLAQDLTTNTKRTPGRDIKAGDIVVLLHSHVVIAISAPDANGYFEQISGNTNKGGSREGTHVLQHRTHFTSVKARIRFTI